MTKANLEFAAKPFYKLFIMISAFNNHYSEKTKILEACTKVSGIGKKMAVQVLDRVGITKNLEIGKVKFSQLSQIKALFEQNYNTDNRLRAVTKQNIAKLSSISSYRGWRHSIGLPSRGQRTHSNAKTCRRLKRK